MYMLIPITSFIPVHKNFYPGPEYVYGICVTTEHFSGQVSHCFFHFLLLITLK